jgi:S-adenosylmethionine synthetase
MVLVMGEITTDCYVDIASIARETTAAKIGYNERRIRLRRPHLRRADRHRRAVRDIAMGVEQLLRRRRSRPAPATRA